MHSRELPHKQPVVRVAGVMWSEDISEAAGIGAGAAGDAGAARPYPMWLSIFINLRKQSWTRKDTSTCNPIT